MQTKFTSKKVSGSELEVSECGKAKVNFRKKIVETTDNYFYMLCDILNICSLPRIEYKYKIYKFAANKICFLTTETPFLRRTLKYLNMGNLLNQLKDKDVLHFTGHQFEIKNKINELSYSLL